MSQKSNHQNNQQPEEQSKITEEIVAALQSISSESLEKSATVLATDLHFENFPTSKAELIPFLEENILSYGISKLIEGFHNNNINIVCKECGLDIYSNEKLKEFIQKMGVTQFLRTFNNPVLFTIYSSALNVNEDQEPSLGGLEEILDEIVLQGMLSWLRKFHRPLLESWCADLSIQVTERSDLVDRIMIKIFSLQQLEDDIHLSLIPITSTQNEEIKKERRSSGWRSKHESSSAGERRSSRKRHQYPPKRKLEDGSSESKKEKSKKEKVRNHYRKKRKVMISTIGI